jgi:hypothetical protein
MTTQQIKTAILQSLKDAHPFLLPEQSLFADANLRLAHAISMTEFRGALHELETNQRVVSVRDEDKNLKWKITDNGLARLAEMNG